MTKQNNQTQSKQIIQNMQTSFKRPSARNASYKRRQLRRQLIREINSMKALANLESEVLVKTFKQESIPAVSFVSGIVVSDENLTKGTSNALTNEVVPRLYYEEKEQECMAKEEQIQVSFFPLI